MILHFSIITVYPQFRTYHTVFTKNTIPFESFDRTLVCFASAGSNAPVRVTYAVFTARELTQ